MNRMLRPIAAAPERAINSGLHKIIFSRNFSHGTVRRLLILFEPNRISYASIFPFLEYEQDFRKQYDVEIRCLAISEALEEGVPDRLMSATHVIGQTWLTDPRSRHEALERVFQKFPVSVKKAYIDSFANADIRWAEIFRSASLYFKKSIFCDDSEFSRTTYGDTNLADFYSKLYGLAENETNWRVSNSLLQKLRLAPNFLTAPDLSLALLSPSLGRSKKDVDLHARLGGTSAGGWYGAMRKHAECIVDELAGLHVVKGTGVSRRVFADELSRSKVCFSPFGYGELCWRDIEAIAAGAVLIKPDMSHLRTEPDLYRDQETYIACRWDFADFADKLHEILKDEEKRHRLTINAKRIARDYLASSGPVATYKDLFEV